MKHFSFLGKGSLLLFSFIFLFTLITITTSLDPVTPLNNSWINTTNVTFSYTVTNESNCSLYVDAELRGQAIVQPPEVQSFVTELEEGKHDWFISCWYTNNQTNETNETNQSNTTQNPVLQIGVFTLTIDTTAPTISWETPEGESVYTQPEIDVAFTYADNLSPNGTCIINVSSTNYTNSSSIFVLNETLTSLPYVLNEGVYMADLSCFDLANNAIDAQRSFTIDEEDPFFAVQLSKESFALQEGGTYTIEANDGADVTLQIKTPNNFTYTWNYLTEDFPIIEDLPEMNSVGTYTVTGTMDWEGETLTTSTAYTVQNNLDITIEGDVSIDEGEKVSLIAKATGGIAPLQLRWTKEDGTHVQSSVYERTFNDPGTYEHKVRVTDAQGNTYEETIYIKVRTLYKVTLYSKRKDNNNLIGNVELDIDDTLKYTDGNGKATVLVRSGDYDVIAYKEGYASSKQSIDVNANSSFDIFLVEQDTKAPSISLLTNNDVAAQETVALKFEIADTSTSTCTLYVKESDAEWFTAKGTKEEVVQGQTYTFSISEDLGEYDWKIECEDAKENIGESEVRSFSMVNDEELVKIQSTEINDQDMLDALDEALSTMDGFTQEQNQIAISLDYENQIKQASKRIRQIQRDLNTMIYRKDLTESELQKELDALTEELNTMRKTVPVGIDVQETKTYVKYTGEEELNALLTILREEQKILNEKNYVPRNTAIQNLFVASTTVAQVDVTYLNEETETITLVSKKITWEGEIPKDLRLVEYIPKSIVESTDDITFITKNKIIQSDPLIDFEQEPFIVYYIKDAIPLNDLEEIETILFDSSPPKELEGVTGLSVISLTDADPKIYLVVAIIVIILVYLFFALDVKNNLKWYVMKFFTQKQLHYIMVLVNDALDNLESGDYDKAAFIYREIKLTFDKLSPSAQEKTHPQIMELVAKLDTRYLEELFEKVESHIKIGNMDDAISDYHLIEGTYKFLDKKSKEKYFDQSAHIYQQVMELRNQKANAA